MKILKGCLILVCYALIVNTAFAGCIKRVNICDESVDYCCENGWYDGSCRFYSDAGKSSSYCSEDFDTDDSFVCLACSGTTNPDCDYTVEELDQLRNDLCS